MNKRQRETVTHMLTRCFNHGEHLSDRAEKYRQKGDAVKAGMLEARSTIEAERYGAMVDICNALGYMVRWEYGEDGDAVITMEKR